VEGGEKVLHIVDVKENEKKIQLGGAKGQVLRSSFFWREDFKGGGEKNPARCVLNRLSSKFPVWGKEGGGVHLIIFRTAYPRSGKGYGRLA